MSDREYETPQETFDNFWKDFVTDGNGFWDSESIKNELHDFYFMMGQVPKVYCHVSGDKASNPMIYASVINTLHDETVEDAIHDEMQDLYDAIKLSDDPDEIKEIFRSYAHVK